jgi:hypothetical protein
VARLLELDKLSSQQVAYTPSRNRQWHMYACSDREPRGPELKRLFLRGQVRGRLRNSQPPPFPIQQRPVCIPVGPLTSATSRVEAAVRCEAA